MLNFDGITEAQTKAITNGGTNNTVIGNALAKRGIFEKAENGEFRYMPTAEFRNYSDALADAVEADAEKNFAETMEREENETPTSEAFEIEQENRRVQDEKDAEISRLRAEFEDADDDRREDIVVALFHLGTVVYPEGSPQHTQYGQDLKKALAEFKQDGSADIAFAEAVDADDQDAMREILNETAPAVIVRDPNATRYEDISKWTDERLDTQEDALSRRLTRRTLLGSDRRLTENRLSRVRKEIEARGL